MGGYKIGYLYFRRLVFFVLFIGFTNFYIFSQYIEPQYQIDKREILIGEKVSLNFSIDKIDAKIENFKILKEEIRVTQPVEIIDFSFEEDKKSNKILFKLVFSIYETGDYKDLEIVLPIFVGDTVKKVVLSKINIVVKGLLTEEEKEKLKKIEDPQQVELKKEKDIEDFRFYFEGYILWLLLILVISFIIVILYKFLLKKILNKKEKNIENLDKRNPYERFIDNISSINVNEENLENSVFLLSEYFKLFIKELFNFNAVSETTKELLLSLKGININQGDINEISANFREMDMVKFAKSKISVEKFQEIKGNLKNIAYKFFKENYISSENNINDIKK